MLKSVQAAVSGSEISPAQELNELWNTLPVEDVVELKHFIEHYAMLVLCYSSWPPLTCATTWAQQASTNLHVFAQ